MTGVLDNDASLASAATAFFGSFGLPSILNGFSAFPIPAGSKKTIWSNWTKWCRRLPTDAEVSRWAAKNATWSVAIACGNTVFAVDIDEEDAEQADLLQALTFRILGPTTFVRIGRAPRRVLVYCASGISIASSRWSNVELLADGRYFVAFGIHPVTRQPYQWPTSSPCSMTEAPPTVTPENVARFKAAMDAMDGRGVGKSVFDEVKGAPVAFNLNPCRAGPWQTDRAGRVVDGRDAFLAHLVWMASKRAATPHTTAAAAWAEFERRADLERPARNSSRPWTFEDASKKAAALKRSGKVGRRRRDDAGEHGFWTGATKHAFGILVAQRGAFGRLSPATVAVSDLMLGLVHGNGTCFASVARLANELKLSTDMVKKARRVLRQQGLWLSYQDLGGKGYTAHYQPNPDAFSHQVTHVGGGAYAAETMLPTVDALDTLIFQGEGGNIWEDLLLEPEGKH